MEIQFVYILDSTHRTTPAYTKTQPRYIQFRLLLFLVSGSAPSKYNVSPQHDGKIRGNAFSLLSTSSSSQIYSLPMMKIR